MSSIIQQIQNGMAVGNTTAATDSEGKAKTKSQMNETKEMFLQLLVTEMQYQDPMQPSDNSEYVKELAQFTQIESLNGMQEDISRLNANSLPGKYVTLTDSESGKEVEGLVDYVKAEGSKNFVSIDGNLYNVADITTVSDSNYFEDTVLASNVEQMIYGLPDPDHLTLADAQKVEQVATTVDGMSEKSYGYLSKEALSYLESVIQKLNTITAAAAEYDKQSASEKEAGEDAASETISVTEADALNGIVKPDGDYTITSVN